jgi:hypothetical protein
MGADIFPALKPFVRVRAEVHEILLNSADDEQIQGALNLITKPVFIYQMKQKDPLITSVWRLAKEAGYFFRRRELFLFTESVQSAGIPMGAVEAGPKGSLARFICSRHVDRSLEAIRSEPALSKFLKRPVSVFSGPITEDIPTSTSLIQRRGYEDLRSIFKEVGISVGGRRGMRYKDIFNEGCPATIYQLTKGGRSGSFFFQISQRKLLKSYIISRAKQLGLLSEG